MCSKELILSRSRRPTGCRRRTGLRWSLHDQQLRQLWGLHSGQIHAGPRRHHPRHQRRLVFLRHVGLLLHNPRVQSRPQRGEIFIYFFCHLKHWPHDPSGPGFTYRTDVCVSSSFWSSSWSLRPRWLPWRLGSSTTTRWDSAARCCRLFCGPCRPCSKLTATYSSMSVQLSSDLERSMTEVFSRYGEEGTDNKAVEFLQTQVLLAHTQSSSHFYILFSSTTSLPLFTFISLFIWWQGPAVRNRNHSGFPKIARTRALRHLQLLLTLCMFIVRIFQPFSALFFTNSIYLCFNIRWNIYDFCLLYTYWKGEDKVIRRPVLPVLFTFTRIEGLAINCHIFLLFVVNPRLSTFVTQLQCCGVQNYTSWASTAWGASHNNSVPVSCCKNTSTAECLGSLDLPNLLNLGVRQTNVDGWGCGSGLSCGFRVLVLKLWVVWGVVLFGIGVTSKK